MNAPVEEVIADYEERLQIKLSIIEDEKYVTGPPDTEWYEQQERSVAELRTILAALELMKAGSEPVPRDEREAFERIQRLCLHSIPAYAYGDNQAACDMAGRLSDIADIAQAAWQARAQEGS